jgi:hypothetical protein
MEAESEKSEERRESTPSFHSFRLRGVLNDGIIHTNANEVILPKYFTKFLQAFRDD